VGERDLGKTTEGMMQLVTDVKKDVVAITVDTDSDGDVEVKANGVWVLWIFRGGSIVINNIPADVRRLKQLGFQVDEVTEKLVVTF
jgi:hypothetical protein